MRHLFGIINIGRYPVIIFPVIMAEHVLILLISGTQNHKLHIIRANLIHRELNQIETFLIREAGNDAYHKFFLILNQAELRLKLFLILRLFFAERSRIIILRNHRIRLRIELIIIDAV